MRRSEFPESSRRARIARICDGSSLYIRAPMYRVLSSNANATFVLSEGRTPSIGSRCTKSEINAARFQTASSSLPSSWNLSSDVNRSMRAVLVSHSDPEV
jgi:hypothetical protein